MRASPLTLAAAAALPLLALVPSARADVAVNSPGGEPQIAVNPRDERNMVVGQNGGSADIGEQSATPGMPTGPTGGVSFSRDGGATWKRVSLPNLGDNTVAAEPDGTFLFTSLNGTVHASRDGGETWVSVGNWVGAVAQTAYSVHPEGPAAFPIREVVCNTPDVEGAGPVTIDPDGPGPQQAGCDRPWLVTDPNTGRAYVSFSVHEDASGGERDEDEEGGAAVPWEFKTVACRGNALTGPALQCGRQYVAASGDGGRTWTDFHPMDSSDYPAAVTQGWSSGSVAALGTLATAYVASGKDCAPCVVFETSRDDGATWTRHRVAPIEFPGTSSYTTSQNFQPYTAADPSRRGRYAVMFFDADQTHLEVYVTTDSGATWESTTLAEPGDGVKRWVPWIAYGPGGALGVMWRTSYADGSFDVWAAVATKGDTRFAAPVRLSSARSPGPVAPPADDASDVTLTHDTLYAAWGDQRGGPAPLFGSFGNRVGSYRFATPSVPERPRPARVQLHRVVRSGRTLRISGAVRARRASTAPTSCAGDRIVLTLRRGRRLISRRTLGLRRCSFSTRVVAGRRTRGLRLTARYAGGQDLRPALSSILLRSGS